MRAKNPWGDVWNSAAAIPVSEVMSAILIGAFEADATPAGTACMQPAAVSTATAASAFLRALRMAPPKHATVESCQTIWVARFDVNDAGHSCGAVLGHIGTRPQNR